MKRSKGYGSWREGGRNFQSIGSHSNSLFWLKTALSFVEYDFLYDSAAFGIVKPARDKARCEFQPLYPLLQQSELSDIASMNGVAMMPHIQ